MASVEDLMGLGMSPELANVEGITNKNTITAAGTVITDATDLTNVVNNVTTAAASTGVQLPDFAPGRFCVVRNGGANALKVYPPSATGILNAGSAGAAVTVATSASVFCFRLTGGSAGVWVCMEAPDA